MRVRRARVTLATARVVEINQSDVGNSMANPTISARNPAHLASFLAIVCW
jgi:hypothetical protein